MSGTKIIPYVKRVMAVEGDTVEVRGNTLYINNKPMKESYLNCKPDYDMAPVKVPKGDLFVMGDNRCNSNDSHIWDSSEEECSGGSVFPVLAAGRIGITH